MIKLEDGEILDLLPGFFQEQEDVAAISYAFKVGAKKVLDFAKKLRLYSDIEHMPEEILDYMAVELRAQYYYETMDVEEKRKIVENALYWHMKAGTKGAVQELVTTIFGEGKVVEWNQFEEGTGEPGTFDIETDATSSGDDVVRFASMIEKIKNVSSHLRNITTKHEIEMKSFLALGTEQLSETTLTNDVCVKDKNQAYTLNEYIAIYDVAEAMDECVVQMENAEYEWNRRCYISCALCESADVILVEKGENETELNQRVRYAAGINQEISVQI